MATSLRSDGQLSFGDYPDQLDNRGFLSGLADFEVMSMSYRKTVPIQNLGEGSMCLDTSLSVV